MQRTFPHPTYASYGAPLLALLLMPQALVAAPPAMTVTHEFEAKWGYTGSATTRGEGTSFKLGKEHSSHVRYILSPQVTSRVLMHFGAEWQQFSFDVPRSSPVPSKLQELNAVIGLDLQLKDQWLIRAEINPGVYSDFEDISWDDANAPLFLGAVYLASPDVQWFMGVRFDLRSDYPVIPALGVRWEFADDWTLNAIFPRPRLEYALDPRIKLSLGADVAAGTFRVGDRSGDDEGWPDLNGELLDYYEVRVGPGVSYKVRPNITIDAQAGYMVYRRFIYADQDVGFHSEPAPWFQVGCQLQF